MSEVELEKQAIISGMICALNREQEKSIFEYITIDVPANAVLAAAQGLQPYEEVEQYLLDQIPKFWDAIDQFTLDSTKVLLERVPVENKGSFMVYGVESAVRFWQGKLNQSDVGTDFFNYGSRRLIMLMERCNLRHLAEFMERPDLLQDQ